MMDLPFARDTTLGPKQLLRGADIGRLFCDNYSVAAKINQHQDASSFGGEGLLNHKFLPYRG
jgi:hypothetical protein